MTWVVVALIAFVLFVISPPLGLVLGAGTVLVGLMLLCIGAAQRLKED